MLEKAKQEPAQRFWGNDFFWCVKIRVILFMYIIVIAKLGMNLAVVLSKFCRTWRLYHCFFLSLQEKRDDKAYNQRLYFGGLQT